MYKELFAFVGVFALFRFFLAGPMQELEEELEDEWDQISVDARHIDHDIAVFSAPDSQHQGQIGKLRTLQEKRNMVRAAESRPILDQFHITKDNNRKMEVKIE